MDLAWPSSKTGGSNWPVHCRRSSPHRRQPSAALSPCLRRTCTESSAAESKACLPGRCSASHWTARMSPAVQGPGEGLGRGQASPTSMISVRVDVGRRLDGTLIMHPAHCWRLWDCVMDGDCGACLVDQACLHAEINTWGIAPWSALHVRFSTDAPARCQGLGSRRGRQPWSPHRLPRQ